MEKIQVSLKPEKNNGTLHEAKYTFLIIFRSVLLRMKNVSDESCREIRSTHFVFSNFLKTKRAFYEIMWINIVEPGRPQMAVWHMHIARWIPKSTNTHSEYVIFIAFSLQQLLQERALILRCSTLPASSYHISVIKCK